MIQIAYARINESNLIIKLSQYASNKDLQKSIVVAIINNGITWLPKYYKTGRYNLVSDAMTKMVHSGKVKHFLARFLKLRETLAARIIQRCWRRCIVDISYKMCYNRLMKEFNELNDE
jgi:hypothetical protein